MIKKYSNQPRYDDKYKEIVHIISQLYKIKTIDRKVEYSESILKKLVLDSDIGQKVIHDLKNLGLTRQILGKYQLHFFDDILGEEFKDI